MLGATHEGIAAFVKTEELVGRARDPDANGPGDRPGGTLGNAEPERPLSAEIETVVTPIDLQGRRQAPRTARQIQKTMGLAVALHELDAFQRFKGADQDGRRDSLGLAHNIQHEMRAIVKENVSMARCEIHRADARCWPAVVMTGGIARRIRFRFNDASAEASGRKFVDDDFPDEEACQSHCIHR